MYTLDDIDVFIPTSYTFRCPATKTIEKTLETFRDKLGYAFHAHIVCDGISDDDRDHIDEYRQFIDAMNEKLTGVTIHVKPQWEGLVGSLKFFCRYLWRKPIIFNLQHDWKALRPIDVECILYALSNGAQYIRFHKRHITECSWSMKHVIASEQFGCRLSTSGAWCDLPHFATKRHYKRHVIRRLRVAKKGIGGQRGVENQISLRYRHQIERYGWVRAHQNWGVYVYGWPGDKPVIRHIGWNVTAARHRRYINGE